MISRPPLRGQQCECAACLLRFRSPAGFDLHRIFEQGHEGNWDRRRCMTETELRAAGLRPDVNGFWRKPMAVDRLAQLREPIAAK